MPDASELLDSADALEPIISANISATESGRRLAAPVVAAIRAAGLQRLMLTAENGGLEAPLLTALEIYERLAGVDPSVSWIVWNNTLPCLFSRFLNSPARAEIFADPDWLFASSTRPSGRAVAEGEGYRLTGRWALVSGCELAEWMPLTAMVPRDDGEEALRFFFVHRSELRIVDTWHVSGLKGTGSHDVTVTDLLVPAERSLAPGDPSTAPGPYGRIPIIATLNLGMAAQFLGIARRAIDATVDMATSRATNAPTPDMRDRPEVQHAIADHSARIVATRSHLHATAATLWEQALGPDEFQQADIAPVFAAGSIAVQAAEAAVDELYSLCGTAAIYQDCPLDRLNRDLRVMRQHVLTQSLWPTQAGRVMLGLTADNPLYAV
jgi:alkylation response protein AidB-like acyl-CoA dehydrogenase